MGKYGIVDLDKLQEFKQYCIDTKRIYEVPMLEHVEKTILLSPEETEQKFKEVFEKGHEKGWEDGWEEVGNFDLHWDEFKTKL